MLKHGHQQQLFGVAGCWVELPCRDDQDDEQQQQQDHTLQHEPMTNEQQQQQQGKQEDVYYYNTATRSIAWSLPPELQQLLPAAGAAGSTGDTGDAGRTGPTGNTGTGAPAQTVADDLGAALSPAAYQALLELQDERVLPPISAIKGGESGQTRVRRNQQSCWLSLIGGCSTWSAICNNQVP